MNVDVANCLKGGIGHFQITENDVISNAVENLFSPVQRELGHVSGVEGYVRPREKGSLGPFEFALASGSAEDYLVPAEFRLSGICRIVAGDGQPVAPDENVSIVNLFPFSLFRDIELKINGRPESNLTSSFVNYKSVIEATLSLNKTAAQSHWRRCMYIPDGAGDFDDKTPHPKKTHDGWRDSRQVGGRSSGDPVAGKEGGQTSSGGGDDTEYVVSEERTSRSDEHKLTGYQMRSAVVHSSKQFDFYIPFQHEFTSLDRYLIPGSVYEFKLTRTPDKFSILTSERNPDYRVEIVDLKLWYKYVRLQTKLCVSIESKLSGNTNAIYPFVKNEIKYHLIPKGRKDYVWDSAFVGYLPKMLIVTMVRNDAFNGDYTHNPYKFQHFNLNKFNIKHDNTILPVEGYTPDFKNKLYMREFNDLFAALGVEKDNDGNLVTYENFRTGHFFLAFDLSPDSCSGTLLLPLTGFLSARANSL
jgi:hypothetical protein